MGQTCTLAAQISQSEFLTHRSASPLSSEYPLSTCFHFHLFQNKFRTSARFAPKRFHMQILSESSMLIYGSLFQTLPFKFSHVWGDLFLRISQYF